MPFKPREITTPTAEGTWVTAEWINAPQVYMIRSFDVGTGAKSCPRRAASTSGPGTSWRRRLCGFEVGRRLLAAVPVSLNLVGDLLPLGEAAHPGPLDRADVHEVHSGYTWPVGADLRYGAGGYLGSSDR